MLQSVTAACVFNGLPGSNGNVNHFCSLEAGSPADHTSTLTTQ